jgi:L-threonylcarbamoyladenylate synthase
VIAVPTDTVYGLVADIYNIRGVSLIYEIKCRLKNKPLTALCQSLTEIETICNNIPKNFYDLAARFFPGPLTIILEKNEKLPEAVTAGLNTIGVRIPNNEFVIKLIKMLGNPLASTSANISNNIPLYNGYDVYKVFKEKIPLVLTSGMCKYNKESSVLDLSDGSNELIREGVISQEEIIKLLN